MKTVRKIFLLALFLLYPLSAAAQIDSLSSLWAEFIGDDPDLLQIIQKLYENPIDINHADFTRFSEIPFLSAAQIDSILSLRKKREGFKSKRELRPILGGNLYEQIKPFFTAAKRINYGGYITHRNYAVISDKWSQDLLYDYNKVFYRFNGSISAGFVSQKDAGERNYFDYHSGFVEYAHRNWRVIAGKYYLRFAEGLTFSNPFGAHKSALAVNPLRNGNDNGFSSLSSNESSGQFGGYFSVNILKRLKIHLYYSNIKRDARYNDKGQIISINYSGYHSTETEINGADEISEILSGFALSFKIARYIRLGALAASYNYSPKIEFSENSVGLNDFRRQYYKFAGSQLTQYSVYYKSELPYVQLSGEYSASDIGAPGFSQTVLFKLGKINFGVKYWYVNPNFQSPSGRIFDSSDPFPKAEQGIYGGMTYWPLKKLSFNFYRLYKKDLWRSYFDIFPGNYTEWLLQSDYHLKRISLQLRIKQNRRKDYFLSDNGYRSQNIKKDDFRIEIELHPGTRLRMKSRWQFTDISPEKGSLIFQDFKYKLIRNLLLTARITFFRTTSWVSRIYEYESDLPGAFANYPLYGQGRKWYLMLRWIPLKPFYFYLKYRHLYFEDTVLTEKSYHFEGLLKEEIRFQLIVKF